MAPKKGQVNNPKGRGNKPNKITADLKARIKSFLDDNFDLVQSDFTAMEPKDRAAFFEKLLKFVIPTQTANDVSLNFEALSEDQLNEIITRLLSNNSK